MAEILLMYIPLALAGLTTQSHWAVGHARCPDADGASADIWRWFVPSMCRADDAVVAERSGPLVVAVVVVVVALAIPCRWAGLGNGGASMRRADGAKERLQLLDAVDALATPAGRCCLTVVAYCGALATRKELVRGMQGGASDAFHMDALANAKWVRGSDGPI